MNLQFWVISLALSLRGADFAHLLCGVCSLWNLDSFCTTFMRGLLSLESGLRTGGAWFLPYKDGSVIISYIS